MADLASRGRSGPHPTTAASLHRLVGLAPPEFDRAGVAAATGVQSERVRRWWRALGFPEVADDESAFSLDDIDMVKRLSMLVSVGLIDDDDVLRLARLHGTTFSRLAEAQIATIDEILANLPGATATDSPRDRLRLLVGGGGTEVIDTFEPSLLYVWRRHLLASIGRWISADSGTSDAAVGFGDLARFTKLSERLEPADLARLIDRFEATCFDVVSAASARVVKLIGDEVMFVAGGLEAGVDICLELIARLAEIPDMPELRCGIAFGSTVGVGGDVFGPTVNLASRLTGIARPGSVMVTRAEAASLGPIDRFSVRPIHRRYDLEGIGRVAVSVIRRIEPAAPAVGDAAVVDPAVVDGPDAAGSS